MKKIFALVFTLFIFSYESIVHTTSVAEFRNTINYLKNITRGKIRDFNLASLAIPKMNHKQKNEYNQFLNNASKELSQKKKYNIREALLSKKWGKFTSRFLFGLSVFTWYSSSLNTYDPLYKHAFDIAAVNSLEPVILSFPLAAGGLIIQNLGYRWYNEHLKKARSARYLEKKFKNIKVKVPEESV